MTQYSEERKQAVIGIVLPPESRSVKEVALEHGIHFQTIYNWLNKVKGTASTVSKNHSSANWSDALWRCLY